MGLPSAMSPGSIRSDLYSPEEFTQSSRTVRRCPSVLSVLSSLLERVVARNERLLLPSSPAPRLEGEGEGEGAGSQKRRKRGEARVFNGVRAPTVSIEEYLRRIFNYANCSPSCFVVAYAYIDRLILQEPRLRITSLNVHRVLITSVLVAVKFLDDIYFDNAYYAQIGGVSTQEINRLEKEFLFMMDFRLHVSVSVFESYCSHLEREVAFGGGYQIEKALRSICAMDEDAQHHQAPPAVLKATFSAIPVQCYYDGV